jgi:TPR repeat protein
MLILFIAAQVQTMPTTPTAASPGPPDPFTCPQAAEPALAERFAAARRRAEGGNAPAMAQVAGSYAVGCGVAQDAGDAQGMLNLGMFYFQGIGTEANPVEALRWLRAAAEAGSARATVNMGMFYRTGQGVAADPAEAARWYRRGVEAGEPLAMQNLGILYLNGEGVAQDDAEAFRLIGRAAALEEPMAMFVYGMLHHDGRGTARNEAEATRWLRRSAAAGFEPAAQALTQRGEAAE